MNWLVCLGETLGTLRAGVGATQTDVARRAGLSPSNVSRLEAGLLESPPRKLDALIDAYAEVTGRPPLELWREIVDAML